MFVYRAKFIANVSVWAIFRELSVLNRAAEEKSPATRRGQHQLPSKAGKDRSPVKIAAPSPFFCASAAASFFSSFSPSSGSIGFEWLSPASTTGATALRGGPQPRGPHASSFF